MLIISRLLLQVVSFLHSQINQIKLLNFNLNSKFLWKMVYFNKQREH